MPNKTFTCEVQVRWGDSDRLGHVNNTLFLEYTQEARVKFFHERVFPAGVRPTAMVVRKMEIEFLKPITDQSGPVTVEVSILAVGNTSFGIRHVIRDVHGVTCGVADAVMVCFDVKTETSVPLTELVRSVLSEYAITETAR
ncbi:acyl-CoA thioesterase [Rhodococcus sp. NPDC058514]|uniref:acyl-CoA thioesterase n=1 Tax=unclassified Rhodococcus (in: high G+C Gram-positive bacteria) TaxID=192944 RepID=UPI003666CED7